MQEAKERGYTTTIFGRRRQITELASDNFRIRQMGERMAQNAPVQGSAADIFKLAMIDLDRALDDGGFRRRMLLTVHDELVLEVPESRARRHRGARARRDGARDRAAGPAHRRHRLRPQLGRGEVAPSSHACPGDRRATRGSPLVRRGRRVPRAGLPAQGVHHAICAADPAPATSNLIVIVHDRFAGDARCRRH